jgi:hypothetical protein
MSVETEIRLLTDSMRGDADRADGILRDLKSRMERHEIKLNVVLADKEVQQQLDRLMADLQKRADARPIVIPTEIGDADGMTRTGGVGAAAGGASLGGGGFAGGGMGRYGAAGATLVGVRMLGDAFTDMAKAAADGTDAVDGFFRGLVRGIPIIGASSVGMADAIVKMNELRLLRAQGLNTPEENEALGKGFDPGIRGVREATSAIDSAEEAARRESETAGLSGFDLQRARARQRAEQQALAVGRKLDALPSETNSIDRTNLEESFLKVQKDIQNNLEKELRAIDAAEAIRETGKALREWFKDLRDHVRDQAKETELDEKMTREAERDAVREGETQARRDRDARRKERQTSDLNTQAAQQELQNRGQGRLADMIGLQHRIRETIEDAADAEHPERQTAARRLGIAQLQAFLQQRFGGGIFSGGGVDFARNAQEAILRDQGGGAAEAKQMAKNMLKELQDINKKIAGDAIGVVKEGP